MRLFAALVLCAFFIPAFGGVEITRFDSPEQERRYQEIIRGLRCLVCQNQTLAESGAGLAADMRGAVARMVREGASDGEITDFITARYGDFALYRPPLKKETAALWIFPFALALLLLCLLPLFFRRRRRAALDETGMRRAAEILGEKRGGG